ncbi:subunit beta of pyruvate dehydrogenase [Ordospora colligata]|uniref:Pyruvate dehydrogenase E1 component subunit beta n=1 Tax=Ordospora colligata OC4 TaxID=1354746 RepID=A0A0B2ULU5_9MICR|nr:subunit beta of pyruvate dehydrogenase [Ordospora colligata OC4]KHN69965.1 subunit beta of pyruvate dehydrogenase [Ordospora colligata OC4]TBU16135.1 subunit beta of pyruvate dehydrogenase [Ordospora colligata]TBU16348.1 subunit beta of pyruvate dehydrogenase [Ordospora colligata]TBU19052.1 subunit beta of pyruvate dehydrogenase [Ordospora colligata]
MITVRDALNQAIEEEMEREERVFVIGEEVGVSGGCHGVTRGLYYKYGCWRVRDTPISEMGFTGLAIGASYLGLRPIVEFMTWNFALQSIDHIINSCAKTLYMSGGMISCPIVFRGPNGFNPGYAAQHTQDFCGYYGAIPGLKVVAPYTARDHKGLMKAAIRDNNPVVFLENETLYDDVYDDITDEYVQELDKAVIEVAGADVTLIGVSISVKICLEAEKLLRTNGISAEVINLVSVRPIDKQTIVASAMKTRNVFVVDYAWPSFSIASEISAIIHENCFDSLQAPVQRISGKDIPTPYSENLEKMSFPTHLDVVEAVINTYRKKQ